MGEGTAHTGPSGPLGDRSGPSGGSGATATSDAAGARVADLTARALAAGRVAIGVVALVAPGSAVRLLLGGSPDAERSAPRMFTRMVGIRDLSLGLVTLDALRRRPGDRRTAGVVALGAACDTIDGLATLGATAVPTRIRRVVAGTALLSAAAGLWQARQIPSQNHQN